MTITLNSHQTEKVESEIASGRFTDEEAVLDAALDALDQKCKADAIRRELLADIQAGIDDLDAGRSREISAMEILDAVRQRRSR